MSVVSTITKLHKYETVNHVDCLTLAITVKDFGWVEK